MSGYELKAVVFDWAGTMIDHGSCAPMGVFVKAFEQFGVTITVDEARGPMGMAKRDHIESIIRLPHVGEQWRAKQGSEPDDAAIDRIYEVFLPMNVSVAADYADLIEGAAETAAAIRARGMKIGSSTGYTRDIMAPILPIAKAQGYDPDALVCTGDVKEGRPAPYLMYRLMLEMDVWPLWKTVKVDDTPVGITEGLNAGCWTVGVALTGNSFGLNQEETAALGEAEFASRYDEACAKLTRAGAHFVIDSVADLMPVLDEIEGMLARGERP